MAERTWNDAVDEIKSRLDIIEVVSKHVILKKRGANYIGLCPFHNEKTPSFIVSPSKGIFKCFGCGKAGDSITFLMEMNRTSYAETIKELATQFNIELPKSNSNYDKNKDKKEKAFEALLYAKNLYMKNLKTSNEAKTAKEYLYNRGITDEIIEQYGIGYSIDSYDGLIKEMKDFSSEILEDAGLIIKKDNQTGYYDRFRGRIMIPIFDEKGKVIAFGSRTLKKDDNAKYINSPDSFVYNKSKVLYGFNFASETIKKEDYVLIMEGYFDVISAQVNGVKNAVASCGTALTPEHIKLISRYCPSRRIYLAFDTDKAGKNATNRGAEVIKQQLSSLGDIKQFGGFSGINATSGLEDDKYSCEIRVVSPPNGKDPDEYIREHGGEKYIEHVKKAPLLLDFQLEQVLKQRTQNMTPNDKLKLVKEVYPILNEISNNIIKNEYIKIVATTLNIDERSLLQEFKKNSYSQTQNSQGFSKNIIRNVTKSSNLAEISQKNLLSLYITKEGLINKQLLTDTLKEIKFSQENLEILKTAIDKILLSVNNIEGLIKSLYTQFDEDNEKKAIITDLIYLSETFKDLDTSDFLLAVQENVTNIKRYNQNKIKDELILQNKKNFKDEKEEAEYQKQLAEQLKKLKSGEY